MSLAQVDKSVLLAELRARVSADLERLISSQREAQMAATHDESRAEGSKDTRSTELSYLARGLAQRVSDLQATQARLAAMRPRSFGENDSIGVSAMIATEDDTGASQVYFLVPGGGGARIEHAGMPISVITPESPLGSVLLNKEVGDVVELRGRELEILELA